ncbi:MAG TPA: hypothetical protein VK539_27920 [Myxococcaceae bacterium]|nr:hypothetical protein [Myxococcaceae bacterium]
MKRSGSTCERRWPINRGPRNRLALIAGLLLVMLGMSARASWDVYDVPFTPGDVEVWTPDTFTMATSNSAVLMNTDGGVRDTIATYSVGTFYSPPDCFAAFQPFGEVVARQCTLRSSISPAQGIRLRSVRHTEAGNAYSAAIQGLEPSFLYGAQGARSPTAWNQLAPDEVVEGMTAQGALGVLSLGNTEHAVGGVRPSVFYWYRDQQLEAALRIPGSFGSPIPHGVDLIPTGAPNPTALLATDVGLFRAPLRTDGGITFSRVPLPPELSFVKAVDVNVEAGSAYGRGFGMALVQTADGGTVVLRSVPGRSPEELGTVWRPSTQQPVLNGLPRHVDCLGAHVCVATLDRANSQNVVVYRNANPPVLTVGTNTSISENSTGTFFLGASDADGDPLRVTVELADGGPLPDAGPLSFRAFEEAAGVRLELTSGPVCQDTAVPVRAVASDGRGAQDVRQAWNFRVIHTQGPPAPVLNTQSLIVQAGGDAGVVQVTGPANPRCGIDRYYWSALSNNAVGLDINGGTARFQPDAVLCEPNGRSYAYRVNSIDEGGAVSAPTDFTIQVRPWGTPSAPFGADAGVGLDAGQDFRLVPTAEHFCQTTPGYPGVDTRWELTQGTPPLENITLRTDDGGVVTGTSAVTPRLTVDTEECADAELTFQVRHYTRDGSGIAGPASTVRVSVDPRWAPVSTGSLELAVDPNRLTARTVAGAARVSNLNCLDQRGGTLRARIQLQRPDGTVVRQGEFPAPGDWAFQLDPTCEPPTTYNLVGELLDVSGAGVGAEGSLSAQAFAPISVEVPSGAPPLEPLYEPRIIARCGEPASGTLQQRLPQGPCEGLSLIWEQTGGPALTQTTFTGQRIDVMTQESDFAALLGQPVTLRVRATTVSLEREHTVPITAEPFVEVSRRTERPAGTDTELLGVSVELHNTLACGVREVSHVERLEGVDYAQGSARFNGAPVEAELVGSELTVRGLLLEPDARGTLTYVVRPRLLGPRRFEGQSSVRGVPISQPPEPIASSGCGCAGGGSGAVALGLLGLLGVRSRRRGRGSGRLTGRS